MRTLNNTLIAALLVAFFLSFSTARAADPPAGQGPQLNPSGDAWRYTFHNHEWWYWLPANRWAYWRDCQWNDYNPKTYVAPRPYDPGIIRFSALSERKPDDGADSRPFYGRTTAELDRRPSEPNNEIGPFYGHALPNDILGLYRQRRGIGPYYGRAVSSPGD
jgi:hypothetical protein